MSDQDREGRLPVDDEPDEEPRDETTAMIYGYDHPCFKPIGRCGFCGGEVWPIEDECWDGAKIHYITFAYECYKCGHFDVSDYFVDKD